jgi:hypothetical protein
VLLLEQEQPVKVTLVDQPLTIPVFTEQVEAVVQVPQVWQVTDQLPAVLVVLDRYG